MAENSKIEWTHHTFNPWRGCTKVSAGCANCYAETMSLRNPAVLGEWGPKGTRAVAAESYWKLPLKWERDAKAAGERRRVFCASLADVFEAPDTMPADSVSKIVRARGRLFSLIAQTPHLDWLLLTKRPDGWADRLREVVREHSNGEEVFASSWLAGEPPANVWVGTSVEHQAAADERIPALLTIPASVRFLSCEPLLGPVDVSRWLGRPSASNGTKPTVNWVILGGESGHNARPMDPDWARSLRDQCAAAGAPFFFKQWGAWGPTAAGEAPTKPSKKAKGTRLTLPLLAKVGKKAAGRVLDGREWNQIPFEGMVPS